MISVCVCVCVCVLQCIFTHFWIIINIIYRSFFFHVLVKIYYDAGRNVLMLVP